MLSNAYFLAKFRFDTAENEPAKNLQKISKNSKIYQFAHQPVAVAVSRLAAAVGRRGDGAVGAVLPHEPGELLLGVPGRVPQTSLRDGPVKRTIRDPESRHSIHVKLH